jgi:hypothetical protein
MSVSLQITLAAETYLADGLTLKLLLTTKVVVMIMMMIIIIIHIITDVKFPNILSCGEKYGNTREENGKLEKNI